ncbi:hypothetical protein Agub_g364, partial [Astrephomene gubernaculifera]
ACASRLTSPTLECQRQPVLASVQCLPRLLNFKGRRRCSCIIQRPWRVAVGRQDLRCHTKATADSAVPGGTPHNGRPAGGSEAPGKGSSSMRFLALVSLVLLTGVSNRVLYRVALVPLRHHIFLLAQLQNLGYLLVYFAALGWRIRTGQVSRAMLSVDKRPLALVGGCEAAAQLLFMAGAAQLPGQLLPVLNQSYLVWSLAFARLILGTRYTRVQLAGAALVVAGVTTAAVPPAAVRELLLGLVGGAAGTGAAAAGTGAAGAAASTAAAAAAAASSSPVELRYVAMCVACFAFPAIANCVKERVFSSAAASLGRPLDIFVVNSFGSLAQTACVLLLLPATAAAKGIPLQQLPGQLAASVRAFLGECCAQGAGREAAAGAVGAVGMGTAAAAAANGGSGAATAVAAGGAAAAGGGGVWLPHMPYTVPLLALSYVVMNLAFNISMLTLLRSVGSVTTTLVGSSLVPLTIAAFTLPLPYLEPAVLGPNFLVGVALLMSGLVAYNWASWRAIMRRSRWGRAARAAAAGGGG